MSIYDKLNEQQKEAVFYTDGPLLILAGAGSGKTRVLTHRTAYLIGEKHVDPWNILAITFTNKAAEEMRDRVENLVGAAGVWVSTFHAMCVRILRRHIGLLGYDTNFTIYDTDDQKTLMREVCKKIRIDTRLYPERSLLSQISSAKNKMITPREYELNTAGDFGKEKIAQVYLEYDRQLHANNALDFDDLLLKTVQLFQTQADVLNSWQERFRYIMVDEYQDTNMVQFKLVSLLAAKYKNLCVVGDDDQSIYKFRGANIKNILNFEKEFKNTRVIKLEQNYRSTGNILDAANAVIRNNKGRKDKTLWTDKGDGEKLILRQLDSGYEEAEFVAADIKNCVNEGAKYKDHAILYRTNAQSRLFEEKFVVSNIPYKIIGAVNFYARREIKDLLAYLKTVDNGKDDLAVRRIINVPKRGVGLVTIGKAQDYASEREINLYEAFKAADLIPGMGKAASKLEAFVALIEYFKGEAQELLPSELLSDILEKTGYIESLKEEDEETFDARAENIDELISKVAGYEQDCSEKNKKATLNGFLEEVALVSDIDNLDEDQDYVVLMTLHSAKGLEFPHVYLVGMEEGLFPGYRAMTSEDPEDMEEERRLCYVGLTRAKEKLTLTYAIKRMVRGEMRYGRMSDFLKEIPLEYIQNSRTRHAGAAEKTVKNPADSLSQNPYLQAKQAFHNKPFSTGNDAKQFTVKRGDPLSYKAGDRVRNEKFGEGTVLNIVEGGRDYEVTVEFDQSGVRKMFAMFAKLQRVEDAWFK